MNTPNPALAGGTDALRGDLRPSETVPRPVPYPPKHQIRRIGGKR
jgi:hypothetical protein